MVSKKAYIRTLEAIIAIVLLLFATYAFTPKLAISPERVPYVVLAAQEYTKLQVTEVASLRQAILDLPVKPDKNIDKSTPAFASINNTLTDTIKKRNPMGYDFSTDICSDPSCVTLPELQTSAYMADTIVSGDNSANVPVIRLVRVWFWRKE